ncbi:hypothetical protein C6P42_000487 [Pichia californica]|nr:hypothetical protein C6P42_000487 [[Candida] californica]
MESSNRDILISKKLSKLLRHKAISEGIPIDDKGFVNLNDVLKYKDFKSLKVTFNDILRIVEENNKKRFKLIKIKNNNNNNDYNDDDDDYFISALQGHSISSINLTYQMKELNPMIDSDWPTFICHGTFIEKLPLIKSSGGLSKMNRNHIHFSNSIPSQFLKYIPNISNDNNNNNNNNNNNLSEKIAISGIRSNANILIFLNIKKIRNNSNLKFFKSLNDVILTPGNDNGIITLDYIDFIIHKDHGIIDW